MIGLVGGVVLLGLAPLSGIPDAIRPQPSHAQQAAGTPQPAHDLEADMPALPEVMLVSAYNTAHHPSEPPVPETRQLTLEVSRGDTLMGMLTDAGVTMSEAHAAIESLRKVFSPRDLRPGFEIRLSLQSKSGTEGAAKTEAKAKGSNPLAEGMRNAFRLVGLSFAPDVDRDVKVERSKNDEGFVASAVEKVLAPVDAGAIGVINSSLYEAAAQSHVPSNILIEAIKTLSYDVDFQRDIQPGDSFELLYQNMVDQQGRPLKADGLDFVELSTGGRDIKLYRFTPSSGFTDFFDAKGRSVRKALMRTPIDGARISSKFGMRKHPILGYSKMHKGIDFAAPTGTPIYAAGNGTVEVAGRVHGYGNYIRLRHGGPYKTAYAHLSRFAKGIHAGSRVHQGDIIGYVGMTGRATGPHLHYEVLVDNRQVNPASVKLPAGETLTGRDARAFAEAKRAIDRRRSAIAPVLQVAATPDSADATSE